MIIPDSQHPKRRYGRVLKEVVLGAEPAARVECHLCISASNEWWKQRHALRRETLPDCTRLQDPECFEAWRQETVRLSREQIEPCLEAIRATGATLTDERPADRDHARYIFRGTVEQLIAAMEEEAIVSAHIWPIDVRELTGVGSNEFL